VDLTLEVIVGPPHLTINAGQIVVLTAPDGQIASPSERGLYYRDTRLLSGYALYANGAAWTLVSGGAVAHYAAQIVLINQAFPSEGGDVAAQTLGLTLSRSVDEGVREEFELTNYGRTEVCFNLEVATRCDFADIFEVRQGRIVRRGRVTTEWSDEERFLTTNYHNGAFHRGLRLRAVSARPATYANGRISFEIRLDAGETWNGALLYDVLDGDAVYEAPAEPIAEKGDSTQIQALTAWMAGAATLSSRNAAFEQLHAQAVADMAALRFPAPCRDGGARIIPAAGLPWFLALFGRDSLIISIQALLVHPEFARGTLDVLGSWQAHKRDDYRDAEPGKIPHELRQGELAFFHLIPHTPYYGTADATPLYLICLHEAWKATGDRSLLQQHLATAEGCLRWIEECGDRDGDGFQEYGTRSGEGYENVGWKDSGTAVVWPDGTQVQSPKALCELQGYVFDAWMRMAEIYDAVGEPGRAAGLREKAQALYAHFNAVFWNEEEGFYAYCLDGDKRPVWTVASNQGHLLWSGIVPPERAARVVERLTRPDMASGWGIRTLTKENGSYNPYMYQNGSVWPHDNGLIALGFKRYGHHAAASRVANSIAEAGRFFALQQLPELWGGLQRGTGASFPVQYLGANVPQGWAAGSVFMLVQAMLGLRPDAPAGKLYVDPRLPEWLPDLTLRNVRVGGAVLDLAFRRDGEQTRWEVLRGDKAMVERRGWGAWEVAEAVA
jgi:glycogen debranching enzyme